MPFTLKSRKSIETPLDAEYKQQVARYARDNDPSIPKPAPKPAIRSFSLVDDTVTISGELTDAAAEHADVHSSEQVQEAVHDKKTSEPVTPAEKNELGIFSVRV